MSSDSSMHTTLSMHVLVKNNLSWSRYLGLYRAMYIILLSRTKNHATWRRHRRSLLGWSKL